MSINFITMPNNQFKLSDGSRIANSGKLYVGKANTDPTVAGNQLSVSGIKEDGSVVSITQPVTLSTLGLPLDNSGNVVTLSVDTHYSIAIFDAYGKVQQSIAAVPISTVDSFSALRSLPVLFEGQQINIIGWAQGSKKGGGNFIGRRGTATDDGGFIAAGNGFYWERIDDKDYVDPLDFGAKDISEEANFDSGPAFRAAILAAVRLGRSNVQFVGNFLISSIDGIGWILPFDDGTLSPSRAALIASGQDSVLPSEPQINMPVHLNLPYGINLVSKDIAGNSLTFSWDRTSVNTQQAVAIVGRVKAWDGTYVASLAGKNRMYGGTTKNKFDGFSVKNAFIGYLSDGISQFFDWGSIGFEWCAYAALFQGIDLSKIDYLSMRNCFCGLVSGGWWLQRNGGTYPGTALPPYPSTGGDIQSLGWTDFLSIKELFYNAPLGKWETGSIWEQVDTFFDTYFFKSANTISVANGGTGRLSSTLHDLTTDAYATYAKIYYRGVASRAFADAARHPRNNSGNEILRIKVYGSHRVPILTPDSGDKLLYGFVRYAYIERTPYYDTTTTAKTVTNASGQTVSNDFYTLPQNKWNNNYPWASVDAPLITSSPGLAVQGIMSVQNSSVVNSIQQKGSSAGVFGITNRMTQYALTDKLSDFNSTQAADFMASDGATTRVMLRLFANRNFSQPISFKASAAGTNDTKERFFSSLAFAGDQYSANTLLLSNGVTDGTATFAPKNFLINTEEERSKITINVLMQMPDALAKYTGILYFPLDMFPDPLLTIGAYHVGPYAATLQLYRFQPSTTNTTGAYPFVPYIQKGLDNKYYARFAYSHYPTSGEFMKCSDINANSYLGFSITYIKTTYTV